MAEPETKKKTSSATSIMPDWSQLPDELLPLISKHLEDFCFDVVHARSVCRLWRSVFPFPSSLLRPSYSLPNYSRDTLSKELLIFEKVPLFLFSVLTPTVADDVSTFEYFLGSIGRDESDDHDYLELPSPLQCSVKIKIPRNEHMQGRSRSTYGTEPTLMKMLDCQIFPLGYEYITTCWRHRSGLAFIPLDKEGRRGEFVVLVPYQNFLLVLTSVEMRWKPLNNIPDALAWAIVTFRGRFYVSCCPCNIFAINPYSLEVTLLFPVQKMHYLVPSGNDELFMVEELEEIYQTVGVDTSQLTYRVSRLDEEAGKWVEVSDLGDRVFFIGGGHGNVSCSAKELPHGCGLTGNSILFTHLSNVTSVIKYGGHRNTEDDLKCWRSSRENRVIILNNIIPVLAFQVER